ncbi:MAG: TIGR02253 family HAD-type hydrolase [Planctomycetes bacterium]|nr:TIGR02253 family HAD-type hydrolase [Planctomycetota bacterium]
MASLAAIFFDIDGTLYSTSDFAARARAASIEAMIKAGVRMDAAELTQELDEVIREFSSNYEHHFDKLLLRIPRRVYKGLNPAMIVAAGVVAYHQTKFRHLEPFEDAYEVLRRLARTSIIRGIITEGLEIKQAEKLVRLRLDQFFTPHAIFISHQLGISKPNIKIYQRACGDLNLKPAECMYVGDNPTTDIDPPNRIGMITVRLRREGRYRDVEGTSKPQHEIQNFWDLLEILREHHGVEVSEVIE